MKTNQKQHKNSKSAFSLVEVNLAIMLISVALLSLFSLFPMGLRESERSFCDTHEATFADHVLSCIEANVMDIVDYEEWSDPATFVRLAVRQMEPTLQGGPNGTGNNITYESTDVGTTWHYPDVEVSAYQVPRTIRYYLRFSHGGNKVTVQLQVASGSYGSFGRNCSTYFTQLHYMGM